VIGSGLPGAALFLPLAGAAAWRSATRALAGPRADPVALAVAAVLAALQLNNLFGNTFVLYAVAPLGWLLLGWTLQPVECCARRNAWPPPVASLGVRRGAGSLPGS
jgi:chromate transport protein ChrA